MLLSECSLELLFVCGAEEHAISWDVEELASYLSIFVYDLHGSKLREHESVDVVIFELLENVGGHLQNLLS